MAPDEVPRGACVVRAGDGWAGTDLLDVALDWLPDAGRRLHTRGRLRRSSGRPRCRPPACCWRRTRWSRASAATPSCGWGGRCPRAPVTAWCCAPPSGARWAGPSSSTPPPRGTGAAAGRPSAWRSSSGARRPRCSPSVCAMPGATASRRAPSPPRSPPPGGVVLPGGLALEAGVAARPRAAARGARLALVAGGRARRHGARDRRCPRAPRRPRGAGGGRARRRRGSASPPPGAPRARGGRRGSSPPARAAPPSPADLARLTGLAAGAGRCRARAPAGGRPRRAGGRPVVRRRRGGRRARARPRGPASGPMTIGALRDLWAVGRRQAIALAAHLDASGLTRRQGDRRALRRGAPEPAPGPDAGGLRASPSGRPRCL